MDFFEAQDRAHSRTKLLVLYFFVAVALIIVAVYFAVTAGVYFYHYQVDPKTAPELLDGFRLAVTAGIVIPLVCLGSLWRISTLRRNGGAGIAESLGGFLVDHSTKDPQERKLINVVEEMAIASGVPIPAIYVMYGEPGINAFAAGFNLDDAAVGVTEGAIDQLDRDELQGVIAHEFSHILNGDMSLSSKLTGWIYGIMMLTLLGRGFWQLIGGGGESTSSYGGAGPYRSRRRTVYVGGFGRGKSSDSKGNGGALILAIILVAVLITIIGYIGGFFARLIQAAVSRQREYLADASAVQFTRNPEGIGNALRRIGGAHDHSLIRNSSAGQFAHAFFSKSLKGNVSFLATHPPLDDRIGRVLRDWQGDYLKPRAEPEAAQEKGPKKQKQKAPFDAIRPGGAPAGGDPFQQMLSAGLFMSCLGKLRQEGKAYSERTHQRLQNAFPEILDDPKKSPLVLAALLYQKDDDARGIQMNLIEENFPGEAETISTYTDQLRTLDRAERLVLLEMLAARLMEALAPSDREKFIHAVESLIYADDEVTAFEIVCLKIVRRRLRKDPADAQHHQDSKIILNAASSLATYLASETKIEGMSPAEVLRKTSLQAPYFMNQLVAVNDLSFEVLENAFKVLSKTPFGIRKQFLETCERIVAADQHASMQEVELLRAIAIGIGVPAAPIFPSDDARSN